MPIRPDQPDPTSVGLESEVLGVDGDSDDDAAEKVASEGGFEDKDDTEDVIEQTYEPPPVPEEARLPRALRRPGEPSKRERDEHRVLHLPYRSWCKECLYGKGNHDQHRTGVEEDKLDKDIPTVSMDYAFMGDDTVPAEENPILVTYDNATDNIRPYTTKKKGVTMWIAKAIGMDLEAIGYRGTRVCLKSDQEEAIVSVKKAVADWRESPTSMIESPARESQCNGKMEKAVQKWEGQLRTMKFAIENNLDTVISVKSKIFDWLSMWAATALNRYHVGIDGKTAFARVTGNQCKRPVAEFGEQVHWKSSVKRYAKKAKSLWEEGTFLGLRERTGEVYVADGSGHVRKCRTIRSRPESERWNKERVMGVKDSVPKVVYRFGVDCSSSESEGENESENKEDAEDAVADLFGDFDEENEPNENDDDQMSVPSDGLPEEERDPNYMNLIQDIKDLEDTLSASRVKENQRMLMMMAAGSDLTEVFSPPRIAEAAREMGLIPGESMDLLSGWDFSKNADRQRAISYIKENRPFLVVGSPPCTLFSVLQGLNLYKNGEKWRQEFEVRKQQAIQHVEFCAAIYRLQSAAGRYWLHEHPANATSWNLKTITKLHMMPGVEKVRADQCMFGLVTEVRGETRPAKKPTSFLTNSWCVAKELDRRCDGGHEHFSLMEGRAKKAAIYPKPLCEAVCKGIKEQKDYDSKKMCCSKALNGIEIQKVLKDAGYPEHWIDSRHEETEEDKMLKDELMFLSIKEGATWAYDDISFAALPAEMVREARKLEIEYVKSMGVYSKVHKSEAVGKKIIKLRWIDVNKMDAANPLIRSRLVAKEYNDHVDPNLFAATPPIEALRYLLSKAATTGRGKKAVMLNDVSRAFFNAKVTREVYIQLPAEDVGPGEKDLVGRLNLCLYGTRDAAMNWQECVAEHLTSIGFQRGKAFPSLYHHKEKDIYTLIHGDDYVSVGEKSELKWLKAQLETAFEIKSDLLGSSDEELKTSGKILNRLIRVDEAGWKLEADPRHAELLVEELGISSGKGLVTPGVDDRDDETPEERLDERGSTRYRSLVARANYLATDRPDISFSVKEMCRTMSQPTNKSWEKLVRVGKYLQRNPRMVISFDWQQPENEFQVYSDANWAGCIKTRKSTSGGVVMIGKHVIKTYSRNQSTVALSSAESEFNATIKAAAEGLGMVAMAEDFGEKFKIRMHVDASAALGVIQRKGIGKIRHLHTGSLWLQEQQVRNTVTFAKIKGTLNPADLFTKYLSRECIDRYCGDIGAKCEQGRAPQAAQLHELRRKVRQLKAGVKLQQMKKDEDGRQEAHRPIVVEEEVDIDKFIFKIEHDSENKFDKILSEWKRQQCRSEGSLKAAISSGRGGWCHT